MAITIPTSGMDTSDATARAADILSPKTAYVDGERITGSIPSKAAATYTPGAADQTIASGQYLSGTQTIKGDADLVAGNIKAGVEVFGVSGTFTSDANAQAGDMLSDKTAYVDGEKVTGSIPSKAAATYNVSSSDQTIAAGQYISGVQTIRAVSTTNISSANIKAGVTIKVGDAGNTGRIKNVTGKSSVVETEDGTAAAADMLSGKTAYVNGAKVTGSIPSKSAQTYTPGTSNQTISSGQYLSGAQTVKGDANLVTANIKAGTTIFGVSGKSSVVDTSDADAVASKIFNGVTAYVDGAKVTGTALATTTNATAARIRSGYKAYDNEGNLITGTAYATTTTATADDIVSGKKAYTNSGTLLTGTINVLSATISKTTASSLSSLRNHDSFAGASNGSYALFAGGTVNWDSHLSSVDAYNASLTRSNPTGLSIARENLSGASVGDYALFLGGHQLNNGSWTNYTTVDAYNKNLTRSNPTALSVNHSDAPTASVGNYAILAAGQINQSSGCSAEAYDTSLTKAAVSDAYNYGGYAKGASVGGYAIFAGGGSTTTAVTAYNASLTRSKPTSLSAGRYDHGAASNGKYALFAGGNGYLTSVDVYNKSLSRSTTTLSVGRSCPAGISHKGHAMFAGGTTTGYAYLDTVEVFDASLTRQTLPNVLSKARYQSEGATVGDYALVAGGYNEGEYSNVDAYKIEWKLPDNAVAVYYSAA